LIAAIHQPQYLPWLGYIDKMDKADVFCFLDNVQYKKNEWQNRNRIKTAGGWQWVTVPVSYRFPEKINAARINNSVNWRRKHLQALVTNYGKAPYFDDYIDIFRQIYASHWEHLSELNIQVVERIRLVLDLARKPVVRASEMQLSDDPTDRLIDICQALDCDTYLAGAAGEGYMDLKRFRRRGLRVIYQDFKHPEYPQLFGGFKSHLSIVDMLFNCGPDSMRRIRKANPAQL
jgi:hypothetical protein